MKKWVFFIVLFFPATVAFANPVIVHTSLTWVRFVIVYVSSFGLEVLITTIILFFCHMAVVPLLISLFAGNLVMYFIIFQPVLSATENLLVAEVVIVVVEGAFIKMISLFDTFQLEDFKGLKWRTAFIIVAVGNALSYYAGVLIGG